jgi:hypothetical protein
MSEKNAVSGQFGTVQIGSSEFQEILSWNWTRSCSVHQYGSNKTNGYKRTVAGMKSGSGSIRGVYDPTDPPEEHIDTGEDVELKLFTTATKSYTVPATIESLELECDIDDGSPVGWSCNFVTDGAWT